MNNSGVIASVIAVLAGIVGFLFARSRAQNKGVMNTALKLFVKEKKDEFKNKSLADSIAEFNNLTDDGSDDVHNKKP